MYRVQPSVLHSLFTHGRDRSDSWSGHGSFAEASVYEINPNQFRRNPLPLPTDKETMTFVESLITMGDHEDRCL